MNSVLGVELSRATPMEVSRGSSFAYADLESVTNWELNHGPCFYTELEHKSREREQDRGWMDRLKRTMRKINSERLSELGERCPGSQRVLQLQERESGIKYSSKI